MQISRKNDNKNRQVALTLVFTEEELAPFFEKGANTVSKKVNIPGYRKGKATKELLEQYGYADRIFRESLNILLPEKINEALSIEKIKPFYDPQFEKIDRDPLTIELLIPIEPSVDLPDYSTINIKKNKTKVTIKQVNKAIEDIKEQSIPWESIEGEVKLTQLVKIDVYASVGEENVIKQKGIELILNSEEILVPGFKEALLGMTNKQQKRFSIVVPDDYSNKHIAGKMLKFRVLLKEIKEKKIKKLDDILAVSLGYSDLKDMEKKVKDKLVTDTAQRDKQQYQEALFTSILEKSSFVVSPILIELDKEQLKKEKLAQQNEQNINTVVGEEAKSEKTIDKEVNARFKNTLVMRAFSKQQKIEITEQNVDEELKRIFPDNSIDKIDKNKDLGRIRNSVRNNILRKQILNTIESLVDAKAEKAIDNSSKKGIKLDKKRI